MGGLRRRRSLVRHHRLSVVVVLTFVVVVVVVAGRLYGCHFRRGSPRGRRRRGPRARKAVPVLVADRWAATRLGFPGACISVRPGFFRGLLGEQSFGLPAGRVAGRVE